MTLIPVSVVLLTRNSARSLRAYFASMREVDDIVVLDGGSTDGTTEFCRRQPNCRVFSQDPRGIDAAGYITDFSLQRNYGHRLARHSWILYVDADEVGHPALLAEVRAVIARGVPGVYYARRVFTQNGWRVVTLPWTSSDQIRLFHTSCVRGCQRPVHEKLAVLPGAQRGKLMAEVIVPLEDATRLRRKYDRYLSIEARANANIPFVRWLRWILLRNLWSIVRRFCGAVLVRFLPVRGPRYPWRLEWEQWRYSFLLIQRTCPCARKARNRA